MRASTLDGPRVGTFFLNKPAIAGHAPKKTGGLRLGWCFCFRRCICHLRFNSLHDVLRNVAPVSTENEPLERSHGATGRLESLTQQAVHAVRTSPMVPRRRARQAAMASPPSQQCPTCSVLAIAPAQDTLTIDAQLKPSEAAAAGDTGDAPVHFASVSALVSTCSTAKIKRVRLWLKHHTRR